ncbi:MAG: DUF3795 domain-containing protein [Deltaproteobacteria bacterium]|nr:DUF3795 domain-containing protein [Deltaproteobacteria bacterium]
MTEMIAYCGLNCIECVAYQATQADSDEQRARVAEQWSKMFGSEVAPEEINCDGCKSDTGRLFTHCFSCEIRACAMEKKVENCAVCEDYGCETLTSFLEMASEARENLEKIRAG